MNIHEIIWECHNSIQGARADLSARALTKVINLTRIIGPYKPSCKIESALSTLASL